MNHLFTQTPLAFFIQNLWRDEAFTFLISQQKVVDILRTTATDFNPPLYYLFMHYWMQVFGFSEIALRSMSLFFYVLTIFVMFEIMVLVIKIPFKRALVYFTLIIYNPVLITYAFEARMYMMAMFFVVFSYFALWTGRKKLYFFAITLAIYTHYFTIFILIGQIFAVFLEFSISNLQLLLNFQNIVVNIKKSLFKIEKLKSTIIPIILFSPWLLFLFSYHDLGVSEFWVIKPTVSDILYLPFVLYTGYQRVFGKYYHDGPGYTSFHSTLNVVLLLILLMPFLFYLFKSTKNWGSKIVNSLEAFQSNRRIGNYKLQIILWSFFPPIILYIVSSFTIPIYHPRYFMFSTAGLLLYIILIIETLLLEYEKKIVNFSFAMIKLPRTSQKHTKVYCMGKKIMMIVIVVLLFSIAHSYNRLNLKYNAKRTISLMFNNIDQSMKVNDRVYLTSELDYFLAKYYMKNDSIFIFGIPYKEIPAYVGKVLIPKDRISTSIPLYPARAFIIYYDRYIVRSEL